MNPILSKFKSYKEFHLQTVQILKKLAQPSGTTNSKVKLLSGYLIDDQLKINKKNSFFNCIKKLFKLLTINFYNPFLCYRVDRVAQSLINELVFYHNRNELRNRDLACVGRILMALNLKTKNKYSQFLKKTFHEKFYNHIPFKKEPNPLNAVKSTISKTKRLRDVDIQNKQNSGVFDENMSEEEMKNIILKQKKNIEKRQSLGKFLGNFFGSWFGNKAANFSSIDDY